MLIILSKCEGIKMGNELFFKSRIKNFFVEPIKLGGLSPKSAKYWVVLLLYVFSTLVLMNDPFFYNDGFVINQSFFIFFIATYVVGIFCWDILFFGVPQGANVILQAIMFFPVFFLTARLFGQIAFTPSTWFGEISLDTLNFIKNHVFPIPFPSIIKDMLCNPMQVILLLTVLLATCFKSNIAKFSIIILVFVFGILHNFSYSETTCWYLSLALVLFIIGLSLHFYRFDIEMPKSKVLKCLLSKNIDSLEFKASKEIAFEAIDHGQIIDKDIGYIISENYSKFDNISDKDKKLIATKLLEILILKRKILTAKFDANGIIYQVNPYLYKYTSIPKYVLRVIQIAFMLIIALLWIISPIDIVPDAIPFIGVLDDSLVLLISAFSLKNSKEEFTQTKSLM